MIKAVFIDGVGRTKDLDIAEAYQTYRWPIPIERRTWAQPRHMMRKADITSTSEYTVADFERIGTLTDGRLVYTQREAKLSLWRFMITYAEVRRAPEIIEHTLDKFLRRHGQPAIVLARIDDREKRAWIVEGVARQMEKRNG